MNSSFVLCRVLLTFGALLLGRWLGPGRLGATSVALWVVSSLSSTAMLRTAPVLRQRHRCLAGVGIALATISLMAAVVFLGTKSEFGGLLERLTLWPSFLWLPFLAAAVVGDPGNTRMAEPERVKAC